jgi:hypothetical protein
MTRKTIFASALVDSTLLTASVALGDDQRVSNALTNRPGKADEMLLCCHPLVTRVGQPRPAMRNLACAGAQ